MKKKRRMGRKAEENTENLILAAFYLAMAGVIGLLSMSYVTSIENNTAFEKSYLAKDISFVSDVIQFAPGDLEFEYNQRFIDLGKFIVDFRDRAVSVGGTNNEYGISKAKYYFPVKTSGSIQDLELTSPYSIDFAKNGPDLFLGMKGSGRHKLECPRFSTPGSWNQAGVTIDPGRLAYLGDKGLVRADGSKDEATLMLEMAKAIKSYRNGASITREDTPVAIKERVAAGGIMVSLHAATDLQQWENPIIIRFAIDGKNPEESRKLACLVGNELFRKVEEFTSLKIYPVSIGLLKPTDPLKVLGGDTVGIWIELGDIEKSHLEDKRSYIADAVWTAIDRYYS